MVSFPSARLTLIGTGGSLGFTRIAASSGLDCRPPIFDVADYGPRDDLELGLGYCERSGDFGWNSARASASATRSSSTSGSKIRGTNAEIV